MNGNKNTDYTGEERSLLWKYVVEAHKENMNSTTYRGPKGLLGYTNYFGPKGCSLREETITNLSKKAWTLLCSPIEDMPLHINDGDIYSKAIALWRLRLGR